MKNKIKKSELIEKIKEKMNSDQVFLQYVNFIVEQYKIECGSFFSTLDFLYESSEEILGAILYDGPDKNKIINNMENKIEDEIRYYNENKRYLTIN